MGEGEECGGGGRGRGGRALGRIHVGVCYTYIRVVLGLGDGAGGGEGGGVEGGVGWELQQRHGRLHNDNEAISRAWKCLLLWRISILGGAFKQEKARSKEKRKKKNIL